jgi:cytochrome c peroxidase
MGYFWKIGFGVVLILGIQSCSKIDDLPEEKFEVIVPSHFPQMPVPSDNPITKEKVVLGRKLFFDPRLSYNNTVSCASCHKASFAMSDDDQFSEGVDGKVTLRNSTPLFNLAYHPSFFRDGGSPTLEMQIIGPIENPLEMNIPIIDLATKLNQHSEYKALTKKAFGTSDVTPFTITRSLAAYMRTFISGNSRYDQYLLGNSSALSTQEKQGLALFEGKANCISCHNGFNLTNFQFENNGLYANYADQGRGIITSNPLDNGKYRVASLRNVSITFPYMHDGSLATLEDVLNHYNTGGANHPNKSTKIVPLNLTEQEKEAIISFLGSLTDNSFSE